MTRFKLFRSVVYAALCLLGVSNASAALIDRGGGMIYDSDQNITWLQDANYAKTSGYDADGMMTWAAAKTWAANLSYGGYDDWRLWKMNDTSGSYGTPSCNWSQGGTNCGENPAPSSSEMAYMFQVNLGNLSWGLPDGSPSGCGGPDLTPSACFNNAGPFVNIGPASSVAGSPQYWSGNFSRWPDYVFTFKTSEVVQHDDFDSWEFYAWAVRDGDVAAVPEPETYAMLLAGLGLLGFMARRRKQKAA